MRSLWVLESVLSLAISVGVCALFASWGLSYIVDLESWISAGFAQLVPPM